MSSGKSILILGCFDTKGEVFAYLRKCILSHGEHVLMINTGVLGSTDLFHVDFESDIVALEGGVSLADLRRSRDRGHAIEVMGAGAGKIIAQLIAEAGIKAVVGMGGGGGTYISLEAMQHAPLGIPKICISTLAAKDLSRQVGNKNIVLVPSIVDVAGLNSIISPIIAQTAAAICAMAATVQPENPDKKASIAISMFGNTTACVDFCTALLVAKGYEVLSFHATGVGGIAMEALIREGCFAAVLDITTTELADDLCGGVCSAGPTRLSAATEMGLPQVVVPGCLDMVNFAHPDTIPAKYEGREFYNWAPDVTLMRTNEEENATLGKRLVEHLNRSAVGAAVVLPLQGISQIDSTDGIFYRPAINKALFNSIRNEVGSKVNLIEMDAHINDEEFAVLLVDTLLAMLEQENR